MVTLSSRKGGARSHRQRYAYLPKLFIGVILLCIVGCIWFLDVQTSHIENLAKEGLLAMDASSREEENKRHEEEDVNDNAKENEREVIVEKQKPSLVVCGGHTAPSCSQCPQGNGAFWCNGDCEWCDSKQECLVKGEACPVTEMVRCGAHMAPSCAECPQGHDDGWCNGDCSWCDMENVCMSKDEGCAKCQAKGGGDENKCNALEPECYWCAMTNQCLPQETVCPKEKVWRPPEPEPWFTPPDPIDKYNMTLSVILPCGNENEFFERTIRSVHAATPPEILHEIIVVDDNSNPPLEPMFQFDQEEYKVKFIRSNVTLGLIDAKHQGAEAASGDIIAFFDCHVKPAIGYWEPFVREIADNPKRVVVPAITAVNVDTWHETSRPTDNKGGSSKCYLTFDADFKWTSDNTPWVPIMSGGLLAIGREWFFKVGGHDQAMKGWGGENIDLSLRIWRCGGEIVAAPQSYVGHMWRKNDKKNTKAKYKLPANSATLNRARALMAHAPEMFANKSVTFPLFSKYKETGGKDLDVTSIQATMKELQCKDFNWYIDFFKYIYRDGGIIPNEVFQLTPDGGKTCLRLKKRSGWSWATFDGDDLMMEPCSNVTGLEATSGTQYWYKANRKEDGTCCNSLAAWNTGQCIENGLKTNHCSMHDQPSELTSDGLLKVGQTCLSANPLQDISCDQATRWEKLRPFEPPEFTVLSQELKDKW